MKHFASIQFLNKTPKQGFALPAAQVLRMKIRDTADLQIQQGKAWLTRSGQLSDVFLNSGHSLELHAGEDVLIENLSPVEDLLVFLLLK